MRISDWSSDVCSSDLRPRVRGGGGEGFVVEHRRGITRNGKQPVKHASPLDLARAARYLRTSGASGYSTMVVQQPSKLNTRVRFPLPAPTPAFSCHFAACAIQRRYTRGGA